MKKYLLREALAITRDELRAAYRMVIARDGAMLVCERELERARRELARLRQEVATLKHKLSHVETDAAPDALQEEERLA